VRQTHIFYVAPKSTHESQHITVLKPIRCGQTNERKNEQMDVVDVQPENAMPSPTLSSGEITKIMHRIFNQWKYYEVVQYHVHHTQKINLIESQEY